MFGMDLTFSERVHEDKKCLISVSHTQSKHSKLNTFSNGQYVGFVCSATFRAILSVMYFVVRGERKHRWAHHLSSQAAKSGVYNSGVTVQA